MNSSPLPEQPVLRNAIESLTDEAVGFLCDMIRFPSTRGNEGPLNDFIYKKTKDLADKAELHRIPESFKQNPEYRWPLKEISYGVAHNVHLLLDGVDNSARSVILNAHTDVVPPSKNQLDAFEPRVEDGIVFGRGACDDKGQIASIYLALKTMKLLELKPKGKVSIDFVIEEENGGNGTLFAIQTAPGADAAIVMEASELKILPAVRGAVWFTATFTGKPGHSGRAGDVVSALKLAVKGMSILEDYHDELLKKSRGHNPLFDSFENPMPVTFGVLNAGDWPATAPATATVKGVFGFLPNMHMQEIQEGMLNALKNQEDEWLRDHFEMRFDMLKSDGNEIPVDHPLVKTLKSGIQKAGITPEVSALTGSCDAWLYNNKLGIPTVVLGAGSLKYAHSNTERIKVVEIQSLAEILINFLDEWCGLEKRGIR